MYETDRKGSRVMGKLSKEYLALFNALTDAEEVLLELREKLIVAQQRAEELYLEEPEDGEAAEEV